MKAIIKLTALISLLAFNGLVICGAQTRPALPNVRPKVAILIFENVEIIDYTGPYEVFTTPWVRGERAFEVYTVSEKSEPITTNGGMRVTPHYDFGNAPQADVLVVPGGLGLSVSGQVNNPKTVGWIQEQARQARVVFSTCNGAFLLAKAGLLKGLEATTTAAYISDLKTAEPSVRPVYDRRLVDSGKVVTSGGLTAGIDGAMHVSAKVLGKGWLGFIATNMEYERESSAGSPFGDYGRKYLRPARSLFLGFSEPALLAEPLISDGKSGLWVEKWSVRTDANASQLLERVNTVLASEAKWIRAGRARGNSADSRWRFTDERGRTWNAVATAEPVRGESQRLVVTVTIRRGAAAAKRDPRSR